ncbi:acyltransferase domain-containing protein [Nostoc sp. UHCC 0702]|nr:acyltransferase domain-containing protein [Nostoc sp. UHCC 0702]
MNREPIAIIGIGCRFPHAKNPEAFWQLLSDGVDAITETPLSRWDIDPKAVKLDKTNTFWGGFLDQVEQFDPKFFGISAPEAASMDPQQRLLLEVTWEALEDAGQIPAHLAGTQTGVFIGISSQDFSVLSWENSNDDIYKTTGTSHCIAANRISYVLNFTGPSIAFDTACSSSLVAVHYACQSLWNEESTLAVAGGVNLLLSPKATFNFAKAGFMAPDGRCKTFDARANGYVRGEGAGVVILKPLSQAQAEGDRIYAVIKGSAVNQDGRSNGLTAPNPQAQEAVLRSAYRISGVSPGQVQYIEAHGTGTSLGDPIEIKALGKILAEGRLPGNYCTVGSVKTNIGHLEAAAGIAGLIKVALSLKHQQIPPSLHFQKPNPYIPFDKLPLRVQQTLEPWPQGNSLALAGVSSFGFGGTNTHMVLAQAPVESPKDDVIEHPVHFLTLSAKNEDALGELAQRYREFLIDQPESALADICFTANVGRSHFNNRLAIVAESSVQLQKQLFAFTNHQKTATVISGLIESKKPPKIAFLFTGQGSQYIDMGRQLYETAPIFRQTLNRCDQILRTYLGNSLLAVLYPQPGEISPLDQTLYTQPALFAIEYALFELWKSWGVVPSVVMGHSVGEYVAACVAGVFSLEDGLKLIAERSRLMQNLPTNGEMVAVFAQEADIRKLVEIDENKVAIAARNSSQNTVISGEQQILQAICIQLENAGIKTVKLETSHAFHSPLMEPILAEFRQVAATISYSKPQINIISNVTGKQLKSDEITPDYWCRHMRQSVEFAASMQTVHDLGYEIFVEVGPKPILLKMGRNCLPAETGVWLASLRPGSSDWQQILQTLGSLYVRGQTINWSAFYQNHRQQKLRLPTYPFQRQRYWIEKQTTLESEQDLIQPILTESKNQSSKSQLPFQDSEKSKLVPVDRNSQIIEKEGILLNQILEMATKERVDFLTSYLQKKIAQVLRIDAQQVPVEDDILLELDVDSLIIIEVTNHIHQDLKIKIYPRDFYEKPTLLDVANYLDLEIKRTHANSFKEIQASAIKYKIPVKDENSNIYPSLSDSVRYQSTSSLSDSTLLEIQTGGSQRPFFCISGGAGNASYLCELAHHLGSNQPFYGLQKLDIDQEWNPYTICQNMASDYVKAIQTVQPQGPYFLGGHSFGGKVAFEMAQQLFKQGQEVALIALLDTSAPRSIKPTNFDWDRPTWVTYLLKTIEALGGINLDLSENILQSLNTDEKIDYLFEQFLNAEQLHPMNKKSLRITGNISSEQRAIRLYNWLVSFIANDLTFYPPEQVYLTRNILFRANDFNPERAVIFEDELFDILQDTAWGWGKFSAEPLEVHFIPGDHLTMLYEPHVQVIAEKLKRCIKQTQNLTFKGT